MIVSFWGTRSGLPLASKQPRYYGGNTSCVSIHPNKGDVLVIDCGTGASALGRQLSSGANHHLNVLFSSIGWDRAQGVPFFGPVYMRDFALDFYALQVPDFDLSELLRLQMRYDFFPVAFGDLDSLKTIHDLGPHLAPNPGPKLEGYPEGLDLRVMSLHHEWPLCAFRLRLEDKVLVHAVHVDWCTGTPSPRQLAEFCGDIDFLITNMPVTRKLVPDYGAGLQNFLELHRLVNIKQTVLTDFNPLLSDTQISGFANRISPKIYRRTPGSFTLNVARQDLRLPL